MRAARARILPAFVLVLAAATLSLSLGFALKDRCTVNQWDGFQYRSSCYNDIFALYFFRGFKATDEHPHGVFPYIHGDGELETEGDGDLEYPVGTGLFVGGVAQIADDGQSFFRWNAFFLAVAGLLAIALTAALARHPRRTLLFALAPAVVLYAFHNWDLLAVALMTVGLFAFWRRADRLAGVALGLGAAAKVFPGLILPALAVARWRERRSVPWGMVVAAGAAFAALNFPVLLANPAGWLLPWDFQSTRFPNYETSWYMLYRHLGEVGGGFWWTTFPRLSGLASTALFAGGALWLLRAESRRERIRPYALAFGLLIVFLLTSKVYSPQFALWLLPFFVLVRMPWQSFVAFALTDVAVWVAISSFFLAEQYGAGDPALRLTLVEVAVWVRYAVLGWMLWLSRSAEELVADDARATVASAL